MKANTVLAWICYALFFLFIYASLNKLFAYDFYIYDLKRSPLLSSYAIPIAVLVPVMELLVAFLIIADSTRRYGLAGAVLLMAGFTIYVAYVLIFTAERPCTCGGLIRHLSWNQHLVFNITFLFLAIVGYRLTYLLK
ncbi:MauE/DoxX family redox-associated membrane protein [Chitinophaga rhizophila]|uniref:Methylamine utilisation protein MauE domain-containing protein n=1 Tax=Chitinophaga rhizophila TaxID=2866212 RepID=A0ABS7G602_9BACT|nr:MauE/DoxX family redox-associated membrane protein [Chitinophaga rhizophila]MBW8683078.1 hypothetical protein [Chitinophaga rhizophila]